MSAGWVWAGARVTGSSHVRQGLPCQDSFATRIWDRRGAHPVIILAVADGAGSAACADVGSALATSLFTEIVAEALDDGAPWETIAETLRFAIRETRLAIHLKAGHDHRSADDYAATLIAAILSPAGGVVGQIGDGAAVMEVGQGWRPVHWPDHGEYANTTTFVTQDTALDDLRLAVLSTPITRIALFTDGIERLVLNFRDRSAHAPFFDSIFSRMKPHFGAGHVREVSEDLALFLASEKVGTRTDDDRTLLCAALVED